MMINVLVAEDEPLILNSITKLIHSLDSDFIVCARAKIVIARKNDDRNIQ